MAVEQRSPAVCNDSNKKEGKGDMTKTPISLQDLRRSLYIKAKTEPVWRFWGLYVHVCKMETLREAYLMAQKKTGLRDLTGSRSRLSKKAEGRVFFSRFETNWSQTRIDPCEHGRRRYRRTGERRSASSRFPRSAIVWSREHSSASWNRSSKLIFNRGRMDTDRNGQRMKRYTEWPKRLIREKPASSILICEPTSIMCSITCC